MNKLNLIALTSLILLCGRVNAHEEIKIFPGDSIVIYPYEQTRVTCMPSAQGTHFCLCDHLSGDIFELVRVDLTYYYGEVRTTLGHFISLKRCETKLAAHTACQI